MRFFVDGKWRKGRIKSVKKKGSGKSASVETVTVEIAGSIPRGSVGMWDLPEPAIRNGKIFARACDDLAGVAAMLCCIDQLSRSAAAADGYFLFTRAEEVGFIGALAACRYKTIPANSFVVAVETSSELPSARMGDGPILRVGDKASIFNPAVTNIAAKLPTHWLEKDVGENRSSNIRENLWMAEPANQPLTANWVTRLPGYVWHWAITIIWI